jgi:hypothetical protein
LGGCIAAQKKSGTMFFWGRGSLEGFASVKKDWNKMKSFETPVVFFNICAHKRLAKKETPTKKIIPFYSIGFLNFVFELMYVGN